MNKRNANQQKLGNKFPKTRWHRLLASVLSEWLTPVGITVQSEVPVTTEPQKADILLLTHPKGGLNQEQKLRLSDGLRQSEASHLLLEFKYTESLNEKALIQLLSYGLSYTQSQKLKSKDVELFLLCSKTPQEKTLTQFGFQQTKHNGVYRSNKPLVTQISLLLLNELDDKAYNMPLKCFASKKQEINKAFELFTTKKIPGISLLLERLLMGLWTILLDGEEKMSVHTIEKEEITTDFLIEQGKVWSELLLDTLPIEERLKGLSTQDKLQGISPEERLDGLSEEELKILKEKLNKM
jgi:hypothetical protein